MPGLVGHVGTRGSRTRVAAFRRRARAHAAPSAHARSRSTLGDRRRGCSRQRRARRHVDRASRDGGAHRHRRVLFHGVLHNAARAAGGSCGRPAPTDRSAALIAELYEAARTAGSSSRLEGEFCLALVDEPRRAAAARDRHDRQLPDLLAGDADGLVFSSDLSALLRGDAGSQPAGPARGRRLSDASAPFWETRRSPTASSCSTRGRPDLRPGRRAGRRSSPTSQLRVVLPANAGRITADYLEAVQAAFNRRSTRALTGTTADRPVALGRARQPRDSERRQRPDVDTPHLHAGRRRMRRPGRSPSSSRASPARSTVSSSWTARYLRDFLPNMAEMVSMTDGMYLSHGLTEMLAVSFSTTRASACCCAATAASWPRRISPGRCTPIARLRADDRSTSWFRTSARRANYVTPGLPLSQLLTPEAPARAGDGARETFAIGPRTAPSVAGRCCSYLYLRELNRRFTVPSLELFRTRVEVRLPLPRSRGFSGPARRAVRMARQHGNPSRADRVGHSAAAEGAQLQHRRAGRRRPAGRIRARQIQQRAEAAQRPRLPPLPQLRRLDAHDAPRQRRSRAAGAGGASPAFVDKRTLQRADRGRAAPAWPIAATCCRCS